jgi:hypothetical protein
MSRTIQKRTRQVIAILLIAGGVWASYLIAKLAGVVRAQWPIAVASGETAIFFANAAILLGFAALVTASVVGGILLWRDHRLGRRLSTIVLAAQIVFLAVPHLQYKIALLGFVGFGLTGSRIGFFFETNAQMFLEFDPEDLRAFVVNIPASVMLFALLKKVPMPEDTSKVPSLDGPSATDTG